MSEHEVQRQGDRSTKGPSERSQQLTEGEQIDEAASILHGSISRYNRENWMYTCLQAH